MEPYIIAYRRKESVIVESSFRGWEDARIVLSERGDFVVLGKNSCYNTKKQKGGIRI